MKYLRRVGHLLADLAVPVLAIGACIALFRLGLMPVLERLLPSSPVLVTGFRRVGSVVALLLGYLAAARSYERRRPTELAPRPLPTLASAGVGIVLIGGTILLLFALGPYRLLSFRGFLPALPLMGTIVLMVVAEETLFRGVLFRILAEHLGTVWALIVQPVFFGLLHLSNEGATAFTVVSVTLLGAFWTLLYVLSRNLWIVIAHHAAWNLTIFVSGLPLSGSEEWRLVAPFETAYQGPVWLTGGTFGPEDSILNIVVMACAVAALVARARRKAAFAAGSWSRSGA